MTRGVFFAKIMLMKEVDSKIKEELLEEDVGNRRQSFFAKLKRKWNEKKRQKLEQLQKEQLSEEESKKVEEKIE